MPGEAVAGADRKDGKGGPAADQSRSDLADGSVATDGTLAIHESESK